jgi:hypothetical protein
VFFFSFHCIDASVLLILTEKHIVHEPLESILFTVIILWSLLTKLLHIVQRRSSNKILLDGNASAFERSLAILMSSVKLPMHVEKLG